MKKVKAKPGDNKILRIKFEYDGEVYDMSTVEAGKFFNVNYDQLYNNIKKRGWSAQKVADHACELGRNYPLKKMLMDKFLYTRRLVLACD